MNVASVAPLRLVRRPRAAAAIVRRPKPAAAIAIRVATADDADAIHGLIVEHLSEGRLLPRERDEVMRHAHRFVVAVQGTDVLGCAELAPLSPAVAEVRSLAVSRTARQAGVGRRLVDALVQRAAMAGHDRLCAFTHAPSYFVQMGFSIVPHVWLPEKIVADCRACPQFRSCGQYAVVRPVASERRLSLPAAALHG